MARYFERELDKLRKDFLALSGMVEENFHRAVEALATKDPHLAELVLETDGHIDEAEVDLEESCLQLLTLYQPFARDLRYIVAVLKINNDLERIGDLAVNLAKRSTAFSQHPVQFPPEFAEMAQKTGRMLNDALDSFTREDVDRARAVRASDDEIDQLNGRVYDLVREAVDKAEPNEDNHVLIHLLTVARHLERTADHATNIAEDVIYYLEGSIVRHR